MEPLIEENVTQQDAEQVAKTIFSDQTAVWGSIVFILFSVIIAVWWLNRAEP